MHEPLVALGHEALDILMEHLVCNDPDCEHDQFATVPDCHPHAAIHAVYARPVKCLFILCSVCEQVIRAFAIDEQSRELRVTVEPAGPFTVQ
jgi:hypothetical protein